MDVLCQSKRHDVEEHELRPQGNTLDLQNGMDRLVEAPLVISTEDMDVTGTIAEAMMIDTTDAAADDEITAITSVTSALVMTTAMPPAATAKAIPPAAEMTTTMTLGVRITEVDITMILAIIFSLSVRSGRFFDQDHPDGYGLSPPFQIFSFSCF